MSSHYLAVEKKHGGKLYLRNKSNQLIGYWITNFLVVLDNFCHGLEKDQSVFEDYKWLVPLNDYFRGSLCPVTQSLRQSYYSGDWNFGEDEYEVFRSSLIVPVPITEEEYRQTIRTINNLWIDIELIINDTERLLAGLEEVNMVHVEGLYDPLETKEEFRSLVRAFHALVHSGATHVRLNVT